MKVSKMLNLLCNFSLEREIEINSNKFDWEILQTSNKDEFNPLYLQNKDLQEFLKGFSKNEEIFIENNGYLSEIERIIEETEIGIGGGGVKYKKLNIISKEKNL